MLTISEVAQYAGVSVRAVRHYHQLGLLPEPVRDELGHRRYDAAALVMLRRISTLADAGVPLRRIPEVLDALPEERDALMAGIDAQLRDKEQAVRRTRRRLARFRAGEDSREPTALVRLVAELEAMGLDEQQVATDREVWQLTHLLYPQATEQWLADQLRLLADPEYRAIYLEVLAIGSLPPDDPRVDEVARRNVAWTLSHLDEWGDWFSVWGGDPRAAELLDAHVRRRYGTPAHRRLADLVRRALDEAVASEHHGGDPAGQ